MLIPLIEKINIEVKNPETGLLEAKESSKVTYYDSNNSPYDHCKSCRAKAAELRAKRKKGEEVEMGAIKMNYKRTGSAYCAPCAKEFHESNDRQVD